ncbi:winged helix-turn-helix transcriptional regulator [Nonomuraea rhodomycinica]|uniref:Helix-turn-helix transcriptional regulator n=1 Tax=Nonomuraea rhodomycinica TaxID=1712872 RepID=A0A7Y6IUH6_9ACTN|nr:helix-turn-helix domain-containing protein [Nonomuraea rhodomycinica]NUW43329.1 helix-turn-helix transcriptional regulator [Nonomuraea rhodomycinica]
MNGEEGTFPTPGDPEVTASQQGNLFDPLCPTRLLLDRVGSRWTTMAVLSLAAAEGELRFTELKREMAGVSQKMLAQTLRALERDGLVDRRVEASKPPRVYYRLTDLGATLVEPLRSLRAWAEQYMPLIQHNCDMFDAADRPDGHG